MLRAAGLNPQVIVSSVDEDAFAAPATAELVGLLAGAKASAVAQTLDEGIVIGCDSMLDLDGRAYGKPASPEEAIACWREMSGKAGTLLTGHCVIDAATASARRPPCASEPRQMPKFRRTSPRGSP